ncbi:MAG: ABC transporter permease [Desulfobacteraceae bacterium]
MLRETFALAHREIRRNVLRSTLTILGIVIGVAAVITMVTLGEGATAQVTADISKLGTNLLQVRPGQGFRGPGGARTSAKTFTQEDAEALAEGVAGLAAVAPSANAASQVIFGNQNRSTSVTGTTNDFLKARNWSLASGRLFTPGELRAGHAGCILGETVKKELFGGMDPVGERIRLQRISFQVVGVLEGKGQSGFGTDQDDIVLIPLKAFHRRIAGNTNVSTIYVSAQEGVSTAKVQKDIERLMRERRRIPPGREDDFHVRDMQEIISTLTGTTRVLTALLGGWPR